MIYKIFVRYSIGRGFRAGKGSRESDKGDGSGRSSDTFPGFCQVSILGPAMLPLRTLISIRKFTNVQAPKSGHAGSGLSEYNPTST